MRLLVYLIKFYQKYISVHLPQSCRYEPSCSAYMLAALAKHGLLKGMLMGIARILRCNPWQPMGEDPVPDYFSLKRNPAGQVMDSITFALKYPNHHHRR